ncbi:hypothetical protein J8273_4407 [Carpediemonas membranifera]|uniref:Uncharacterized protein n=1 Tax=Carpediemonas membranifera TaxID=201153 RepID=A0A8J6DZS3_9EUKA|nr:hypothetical protein J8273_4407 [Carpediemonas membranifera]|eukprot:KAG9394044.1 hypothetical protein J8273_4407 [Carpediemonas membranifera]
MILGHDILIEGIEQYVADVCANTSGVLDVDNLVVSIDPFTGGVMRKIDKKPPNHPKPTACVHHRRALRPDTSHVPLSRGESCTNGLASITAVTPTPRDVCACIISKHEVPPLRLLSVALRAATRQALPLVVIIVFPLGTAALDCFRRAMALVWTRHLRAMGVGAVTLPARTKTASSTASRVAELCLRLRAVKAFAIDGQLSMLPRAMAFLAPQTELIGIKPVLEEPTVRLPQPPPCQATFTPLIGAYGGPSYLTDLDTAWIDVIPELPPHEARDVALSIASRIPLALSAGSSLVPLSFVPFASPLQRDEVLAVTRDITCPAELSTHSKEALLRQIDVIASSDMSSNLFNQLIEHLRQTHVFPAVSGRALCHWGVMALATGQLDMTLNEWIEYDNRFALFANRDFAVREIFRRFLIGPSDAMMRAIYSSVESTLELWHVGMDTVRFVFPKDEMMTAKQYIKPG